MKPGILTSNLLTRKGAATPISVVPPAKGAQDAAPAEGVKAPQRSPEVMRPRPIAEDDPTAAAVRSFVALQRRARLSIRLDAERHLRVKLLAMRQQRPMQDVIIEALDHYLSTRAPAEIDGLCRAILESEGERNVQKRPAQLGVVGQPRAGK